MKRHECLQPFSRDHNVGLVVSRYLMDRPGKTSLSELVQAWDDELQDHFEEEERLLLPISPPQMQERMRTEHDRIRKFVDEARAGKLLHSEIIMVGLYLSDHIRWEERELFPILEGQQSRLENIAEASRALEARRAGSTHSPRRGA